MTRLSTRIQTLAAAGALLAMPAAGQAATWSDTFVGYRYGSDFREPTNTKDVDKHVLQFTHASGYSVGQNFVNLDVLQSDKADPASGGASGATEFYLTYRHQLHLGKLLDKDLSFGPVKASHYTHLPPLYPIVLSDEHTERADELGEAGV